MGQGATATSRWIWVGLAAILTALPLTRAADPWPAETNTAAVNLTSVDAGLNAINWSGAFWNPDTRTLWLSCNSGWFWALEEDGEGSFQVVTNAAGTKAKWTPGGDLEDICQADLAQDIVYLMDENGWIKEYDISQPGMVALNRSWDIRAHCPEASGLFGGEGIDFIPNEYLTRQGFCDTNGTPILSTNGMDGLMFVGYQNDGFVYAFDLDRALNTYTLVGRYKTGQTETADLAFDRATGKLYIWHNPGNINTYLEVTELNSVIDGADRRFLQIAEYIGSRTGNLEGFALVPTATTNATGGCIVTDDDNVNTEAVLWYRQFQPNEDTDADGLSDGWELWHFGSTTQTTGSMDSDDDGMINSDEETAGTDPADSDSVLLWEAPVANSQELVLSWQSVTGQTYGIQSATFVEIGFTNPVLINIAANTPLNVTTLDVSGLVSNTYYRIAIEEP